MEQQHERENSCGEQSESEAAIDAVRRLSRRLTESQGALTRAIQQTQASQDARVLQFIGFLTVDIPELHRVEVPLLLDAWERFKLRSELATAARVSPPEAQT